MITHRGRKYLGLIMAILLTAITINTVIFANIAAGPLKSKNIIIDPGHGGVDPGANDGESFFEKDINLQIAGKLKEVLESHKACVSMTRDSDVSLDNQNNQSSSRHTRDLIARVTRFNSGNYDIFISIHVNRSSNNTAIGPIVLYSGKYPESSFLAECLQEKLNKLAESMLGKQARHNPVKSDFYILKNSNIPGVIIEAGFMSNPTEKKLLREKEYQYELCISIYSGITDYFKYGDSRRKPMPDNGPSPDEEDGPPFNIINEVKLVKK